MTNPYEPYSGLLVSLADAKAAGDMFYFTGRPCKRGHVAQRRTINANCSICNAEQSSRWQRQNPESANEIYRQWRLRNPEQRRAIGASWFKRVGAEQQRQRYKDDPEKHRKVIAKWRADNPEKARMIDDRRRAKLLAADGSHTAEEVHSLFVVQRGFCAYASHHLPWCSGKITRNTMQKDHIQPLSKGGSNDIRNIQLTCRPCNARKSAKDAIVFAQEIGLLV